MKLVVLSFNSYELYFRREFCEASERMGIPVLFIEWSNLIYLTRKNENKTNLPADTPVIELARLIREFSQNDNTCIIDSMMFHCTHKAFWLRKYLREMLWIYDVFDYYFYNSTGKRLLMAKLKDLTNRLCADKIVVLSKPLLDIYPGAFLLNNASHLAPSLHRKPVSRKQTVTIASFNERFDFNLLEELAILLPEYGFHLYGWILDNSPDIGKTMSRLTNKHRNIIYHGPYTNSQLDHILDEYDIGLLPYIDKHILTRYINPDKLYHYLCKGLEVVSTPIPQALEMQEHLHLASNATEFAEKIRTISEQCINRNNNSFHLRHNWDLRLTEFLKHVANLHNDQ